MRLFHSIAGNIFRMLQFSNISCMTSPQLHHSQIKFQLLFQVPAVPQGSAYIDRNRPVTNEKRPPIISANQQLKEGQFCEKRTVIAEFKCSSVMMVSTTQLSAIVCSKLRFDTGKVQLFLSIYFYFSPFSVLSFHFLFPPYLPFPLCLHFSPSLF